jgi:DNA-binding transcriptional MerR regulator
MSGKTYNMKEAAKLLGVTYRTIRYYKEAYPNEVHQDGRDVQLTERFLELVRKNRKINTNRISDNKTKKEYKEELDTIKAELEQLKSELKGKYQKALQEQKGIYEEKLGKFKDYDYDEENERLEIFTHEEYAKFEDALREWRSQNQMMQQQREQFNMQLASKEELIEHYRVQFDYQKQQSDRILGQMDKLIEAIKRRDTIEAVEKKVIGQRHDME